MSIKATIALAALLSSQSPIEPTPAPRFEGSLDVSRQLITLRVVDYSGAPVAGLGIDDFTVEIGGQTAEVEAADLIELAPLPAKNLTTLPIDEDTEPRIEADRLVDFARQRRGRTVIMLYQIDLESVRLKGFYRMVERSRRFAVQLPPEDRVAVFVYRSHLELRQDLRSDRSALDKLLAMTQITRDGLVAAADGDPALASLMDLEAARDVATIEQALKLIGETLEKIEGPKDLLFFGWGVGTYKRGGVTLGPPYRRAQAALNRADVTVFSIDVTDADTHSLEKGLIKVAEDTGGMYLKTHMFPDLAISRVARVMSSQWELVVVTPPGIDGIQPLSVEVPGWKNLVMVPKTVDLGCRFEGCEERQ